MRILLFSNIAVALGLTLVYEWRPDRLAALTILPAWLWMSLALGGLPFLRRKHRHLSILFLATWSVFAWLHVEEIHSVPRGWISPISHSKPAGTLRLVTLNCGGGQPAALQELKGLEADIVFLQESPPATAVAALLPDLFGTNGACICHPDTAILVRGSLTPVESTPRSLFYSHAIAHLPGWGDIHLVSLRLLTGNVRVDLWNPACWKIHVRHRRAQLDQIRQIAARLPATGPLIVAGDFNAPQGDKIFSFLPHFLQDTFSESGKGIGNTLMNDFPVLRIDQIWSSRDLPALQSFTRQGIVSDHRMVVSDVIRNPNPADPL